MDYCLAQSAWGRGIATEVAFIVVAPLFETSDADRMKSGHMKGGDGSCNVSRKDGMRDARWNIQISISCGEKVFSREMEMTVERWTVQRRGIQKKSAIS